MAVATSTHQQTAEKYLKKAQVYEYFDQYVYGDMISKGKPDPEIFQVAAGKLSLSTRECIAFEDSPHGITAAKAAECKVIAVPDLTPIEGEILAMVDAYCKNLRVAMKHVFD